MLNFHLDNVTKSLLLFPIIYMKQFPFTSHKVQASIVNLDCISIIQLVYCQLTSELKILASITIFHHAATQNPGHGTKFVTLPSSILLYEFYVRSGSMCLNICNCNHYLLWLILLLLCGHK